MMLLVLLLPMLDGHGDELHAIIPGKTRSQMANGHSLIAIWLQELYEYIHIERRWMHVAASKTGKFWEFILDRTPGNWHHLSVGLQSDQIIDKSFIELDISDTSEGDLVCFILRFILGQVIIEISRFVWDKGPKQGSINKFDDFSTSLNLIGGSGIDLEHLVPFASTEINVLFDAHHVLNGHGDCRSHRRTQKVWTECPDWLCKFKDVAIGIQGRVKSKYWSRRLSLKSASTIIIGYDCE